VSQVPEPPKPNIMRRFAFLLIIILALANCQPERNEAAKVELHDSVFISLADEYLDGFLRARPRAATYLGIHDYDGQLTDLSKAALDAEQSRLRSFDEQLISYDTTTLSPRALMDFKILHASIKQELFSFVDLRQYQTSPLVYASNADVSLYVTRDFASPEVRMRLVDRMQRAIPEMLKHAHENLDDSLARPHIETAVQIARGAASFMQTQLKEAFASVKNDSLSAAFNESNKLSVEALNAYAAWLEKEKLPKAHNHYAIGRDNYVKMLLYNERLTTSPEEILKRCEQLLKEELAQFAAVAKKIDAKKKAGEVFNDLKNDHSTAANLIPDARKNAESIRQFLLDKKIISMPSDVRVTITETPEFARATSTASMDTPGPFEKATQAYYYITPVDVKWSKKRQEEWLSLFSRYVTDVITIHEAYPGHYTQFLHLNASKATRVEKIFPSYAFVEGWAHYTEQMMIEEGFGAQDSLTQARYHLAQLNESLLRLCRMYVSLKMHLEGMTVEQATKFFEENAFYEHEPAHHEAVRGTFDPGYLSYALGKQQFLKLREDYRAKMGDKFSLQEFHDKVLSFGGPPIVLLREAVLAGQ
jgi:uncharacterized protein (DUF885 family)